MSTNYTFQQRHLLVSRVKKRGVSSRLHCPSAPLAFLRWTLQPAGTAVLVRPHSVALLCFSFCRYANESTCKILVGNKCEKNDDRQVATEEGQVRTTSLSLSPEEGAALSRIILRSGGASALSQSQAETEGGPSVCRTESPIHPISLFEKAFLHAVFRRVLVLSLSLFSAEPAPSLGPRQNRMRRHDFPTRQLPFGCKRKRQGGRRLKCW